MMNVILPYGNPVRAYSSDHHLHTAVQVVLKPGNFSVKEHNGGLIHCLQEEVTALIFKHNLFLLAQIPDVSHDKYFLSVTDADQSHFRRKWFQSRHTMHPFKDHSTAVKGFLYFSDGKLCRKLPVRLIFGRKLNKSVNKLLFIVQPENFNRLLVAVEQFSVFIPERTGQRRRLHHQLDVFVHAVIPL
jgi:hypothetical protein